ncbi:hypothetical protein [Paenibacillus dendritiformis]|uniref:hypothetical protein n=1 Tax=Paenibacillus dendritiformis TaxID=130049 RepID=UPI001BCD7106|nr:hypothetical protein [Paenibacillus dendritiformis]
MSPPPGEMLQIYIILGLFASSRCETGEIPVILQDSLSGKVVPIELLYLCRISLTESACPRKWRRFQAGGIIHFPTHNFFLNSLKNALFSPFFALPPL